MNERYLIEDAIETMLPWNTEYIFTDFESMISFVRKRDPDMGSLIVYRETAEPGTWVYIGTI